jgi:spore germination cell wall hydrolase CwlJ-like protein
MRRFPEPYSGRKAGTVLGVKIANLIRWCRSLGLASWAPLALLIPAASCVPASFASTQAPTLTPAEIAAFTAPAPLAITNNAAPGTAFLVGDQAAMANAAIPVSSGPLLTADAYVFAGRTPLDRMRSEDCLAQAVYYEARSESEDGQRAVAQVVLNRVRNPAWPNSVCGVVYQSALRPGGGCQFTFTCDGSLAIRPSGPAWAAAQRIAVDALGGRTYAPVGLSTFYHANYVFPAWAPQLVKTATIGAHIFYRMPGLAGAPGAFANAYSGSEPMPHWVQTIFYNRTPNGPAGSGAMPLATLAAVAPADATHATRAAPARPASDIADQPRWTPSNLPDSNVREEHAQSGQWRSDAPAAVTGR